MYIVILPEQILILHGYNYVYYKKKYISNYIGC